jgi:predicted DNA-binding transcriptional regulator
MPRHQRAPLRISSARAGAGIPARIFRVAFGYTELLITDYWTLRARSADLFQRNIYARGLIRRLVTNEINVGLHLEATPEEAILGKKEDELADWSEEVENRFRLWCDNPAICDQQ